MEYRYALEDPQRTRQLADAVLAMLKQWRVQPNAKLRELCFPVLFLELADPHAQAFAYIAKIAQLCPHIENLDGYAQILYRMDDLSCDEQWRVGVYTWELFCRSFPRLRQFDWVVAPYATQFFELFGRYRKPQLEKLVFATPMNWNWAAYHRGAGGVSERVLEVATYLPGDDGDRDEAFLFGERVPAEVPTSPMMDQEIFNDDFFEALARLCPHLDRPKVLRVMEIVMHKHTIMGLTDRTIQALASKQRLSGVELKSVNISGDGLFSAVVNFTHGPWPIQRDYALYVGDEKGKRTVMAFYHVVWSERYTARLRPLVTRVQRTHPTVHLHLVMRRYRRDKHTGTESFGDLVELGFYTVGSAVSAWYGWENDPQDTRINDVVTRR